MPKKPTPANIEDVEAVRSDLAEVRALAEKTDASAQALKKENAALKSEVKQLQQKAETLATLAGLERVAQDSKSFVETAEQGINTKLAKCALLTQLKNSEGSLETKINTVDAAWRSALADELARLGESLSAELENVKAELATGAETWARQAAEALVDQKKVMDASLEEVKAGAVLNDDYVRRQLTADLEKFKVELEEKAKKQDERDKLQEAAIHEALGNLDFSIKETASNLGAEGGAKHDALTSDLAGVKEEQERRLGAMEKDFDRFRDAVAEVENLSTRRVDWVIRHASKRLLHPNDKASLHTSWFSPKFNAAGIQGLQLEFQLFRPSDPPVKDELSGDCAIFLWACRGANLVYRLHVGGKAATLEKVFNGRVPYGTERFCFLKDQINREDDTLRLSVEVLEAVREVEHTVNVVPPPPDKDPQFAAKTLEGIVQYRRHVNNRLFDQVKQQVELMQSRMVRRIEWRVENASILKRCFPAGEPICSTTFNAAGIEGMQLVFYPSGYAGSTDGFCSLFLYAPAGATLRCALTAGSQKREAHHTFEDAGAFGRTNFCRFESAIDEELDTVTLGLEVEEAHQDMQALIAHPTLRPGDRRTQAELDGSVPGAVRSVVSMRRIPGKNPPGLDATSVLPSLWTAKALGDLASPNDGLHSFDELRAQRGGMGRTRGGFAATDTLSRRSESVPSLGATDRSPGGLGRTTGQNGDGAIPLPQLAKAGVSRELFGASMGGKARKQRLY
jgi:hypothetical protein